MRIQESEAREQKFPILSLVPSPQSLTLGLAVPLPISISAALNEVIRIQTAMKKRIQSILVI
jgi:hypothetical protein